MSAPNKNNAFVDDDDDAIRRRNEMNMFSMMATGGEEVNYFDNSGGGDNDDDDDFVVVPKKTASAAATTTSHRPPTPPSLTDLSAVTEKESGGPASSSTNIATTSNDNTATEKEEEDRRRKEMSLFAAMASGDYNYDDDEHFASKKTTTKATTEDFSISTADDGRGSNGFKSNRERGGGADDSSYSTTATSNDDCMTRFANAASKITDTGTFTLSPATTVTGTSTKQSSSSDLEAAAASLATTTTTTSTTNKSSLYDDVEDADCFVGASKKRRGKNKTETAHNDFYLQRGHHHHGSGNVLSPGLTKSIQPIPMYTEKVLLPRPLFFGSKIPTKIIEEAKEIVQISIDDINKKRDENEEFNDYHDDDDGDNTNIPKFSLLPPEVRNLINVVDTFGFGVSIYPPKKDDNGIEKRKKGTMLGNPYVSTYQPVFGDVARRDREERISQIKIKLKSKDGVDDDTTSVITEDKKESLLKMSTSAVASLDAKDEDEDSLKLSKPTAEDDNEESSQLFNKAKLSNDKSGNNAPTQALTPTKIKNLKLSDKELFAKWALNGGDDDGDGNDSIGKAGAGDGVVEDSSSISMKSETSSIKSNEDDDANRDGANNGTNEVDKKDPTPMSDRDLFSSWALGEQVDNTATSSNLPKPTLKKDLSTGSFVATKKTHKAEGDSNDVIPFNCGTFVRAVKKATDDDDSDDDSVVGSELQKQVGVSESLNAALASLQATDDQRNNHQPNDKSGHHGPPGGGIRGPEGVNIVISESITAEDADKILSQLCPTTQGGRPFSNLELTDGCVPLYGCDDTPLPIEADLGIFETKDDQILSVERRRSHDIIDKHAAPKIFGPIACPNPSINPDDSQSWFSRTAVVNSSGSSAPQQFIVGGGTGATPRIRAPSDVDESPISTSSKKEFGLTSPPAPSGGGATGAGLPPLPPPQPTVAQQNHRAPTPSTPQQQQAPPAAASSPSSTLNRWQQQSTPTLRGNIHQTPATGGSMSTRAASQGSIQRAAAQSSKRFGSSTRIGWWHAQDDSVSVHARDGIKMVASPLDGKGKQNVVAGEAVGRSTPVNNVPLSALQLPPVNHAADSPRVNTRLTPTPEKLREENFPLSHLHCATSTAEALPFLSDRSPSYRYLQIDTQAVGFPPVGGEIEPLFCSLAIYHIETTSTGGSNNPMSAPVANRQRCGRVTEILNFDVVSDPDVEKQCMAALWPYASKENRNESKGGLHELTDDCSTQGTRCGVFPLPSNLKVSNLYAILIVHKVLSDGSDVDVYMKHDAAADSDSTGSSTKGKEAATAKVVGVDGGADGVASADDDIGKLRRKSHVASEQRGKFLLPFAFGVAPLLQVIGTDIPSVPSSRAVQIPLFRLSAGEGINPIIDHIMVMLYPRADHGNATVCELTNGGTAMLVMRNYGFLGLHSVIHSKSTLARDRLVDFTGELQMRRRNERDEEAAKLPSEIDSDEKDGRTYFIPQWRPQFIAEETCHGGRNSRFKPEGSHSEKGNSRSHLYAQELAAVPLQLTPSTSRSMSTPPRVRTQRNDRTGVPTSDAEPSLHTSFCNFLLCHPRLLHHCPKSNIVVKVELREVEWIESQNAYLAYPTKNGPSVHNPRRGPYLVQEAFTSCAYDTLDPHFIDEFKVKLPLILKKNCALLFTVYNIDLTGKKRPPTGSRRGTASKLRASLLKRGNRDSDDTSESKGNHQSKEELLACGFLPIASDEDSASLIENGLHDVKLAHTIVPLPPEGIAEVTENLQRPGAILIRRISVQHDTEKLTPSIRSSSSSGSAELRDQPFLKRSGSACEEKDAEELSRATKGNNQMILQVRVVVHSSVHPQNGTLSKFLRQSPNPPQNLTRKALSIPRSPWCLQRQDLLQLIKSTKYKSCSSKEGKLLLSTIDVSQPSQCSATHASTHFFRSVIQLLRTTVTGMGEPSLLWANPASIIPLRLHSFAAFLQLVDSVTNFMMKNGLTNLDGRKQWNLTVVGRILAMIFDEETVFSTFDCKFTEDPFDLNDLSRTVQESDVGSTSVPLSTVKPVIGNDKKHSRSRNDNLWTRPPEEVDKPSKTSHPAAGAEAHHSLGRPLEIDTTSSLVRSNAQNFSDVNGDESKKKESPKIDTKFDFQHALASSKLVDDTLVQSPTGTSSRLPIDSNYTYNPRRKWQTLPSSALTPIREDASDSDLMGKFCEEDMQVGLRSNDNQGDTLDPELFLRSASKSKVKQFRVPKTKKDTKDIAATTADSLIRSPSNSKHSLPTSDEEIEKFGNSFLDGLRKQLGTSGIEKSGMGGEDKHVGYAHHRKTRSRCSIDWTLPETDMLMENEQHLEHIKRRNDSSDNILGSIRSLSDSKLSVDDQEISPSDSTLNGITVDAEVEGVAVKSKMSTLSEEEKNTYELPGFVDRIVKLANKNGRGRWFPYLYEVIIFQWQIILTQQRTNTSSGGGSVRGIPPSESQQEGNYDSDAEKSLANAAAKLKSRGVAISCAPVLFEMIRKSLGWRIHSLLGRASKGEKSTNRRALLLSLDSSILSALEHLISMLTDACIDNRNFDSYEFRQTAIDVNDAIVRFLRDMFAFVDTKTVHRLTLVYFSRYVLKQGFSQDKDSLIGLRGSWEVFKLRLNAVTTLVRFPDFVRVCSPQMNSWGNWPLESNSFFDFALNYFEENLGMPIFGADEGLPKRTSIEIPSMRPHWLVELVTDICLSGTEHAEQSIQNRSSSLLHEMFWAHCQEAKVNGTSSAVASMYVPFLSKVLGHINYLSNFAAKTQLRKDILPCVVFVLQCAPVGLLRALWRKLCTRATGKGLEEKFGGVGEVHMSKSMEDISSLDHAPKMFDSYREEHEPDVFDMYSLLNLALSTFEYEGSDSQVEDAEIGMSINDPRALWQKEFLVAVEQDGYEETAYSLPTFSPRNKSDAKKRKAPHYSTSSSRKWHCHDGSIVIINTSRHIVREMLAMLHPSAERSSGPPDVSRRPSSSLIATDSETANGTDSPGFSFADTIIFVRAATSLYLHSLSLNQSDIAIVKTLTASVEVVKIFGIKVFLEAVGETLQHWMRVVSVQCGARRAAVRFEALEFLALLLRLAWDTYGSFFRIRLPLLAVQTEVMERIVALSAARYYREQRRTGTTVITSFFSNDSAEASLAPLWRSMDRLHHKSASQNVGFRSALMRLAEKEKKLFRAYVAAHALGILNRPRPPLSPSEFLEADGRSTTTENSIMLQNTRVRVHRIINASAGFSKQFLGFQSLNSEREPVAHNEVVEDAFLAAADVFSPTELPSHRVAWLTKLAEFHASRSKCAEEATCRFHIHVTLQQAARLHDRLWSSVPFLPWASDANTGVHVGGEGAAGGEYYDADYGDVEDFTADDFGLLDMEAGKQFEKSNTFRRIFYRVQNSLRTGTGNWEIGGSSNLFYGVTFASEYRTITPWISLRELEEDMVEAAETAGDLYLKAGIIESSRYTWSLATQFYAKTFNYAKLAYVYKQLAHVVASQIPVVDTTNQLELSSPLGRFYRVHFHGGAPDELIGTEFVHRAAGSIKLERFGRELVNVMKNILPDKTPIDLILDDGRLEETAQRRKNQRRPLGAAPLEPVKIKVTPLRPLLKCAHVIRGTPEWFYKYTDEEFDSTPTTKSSATMQLHLRQKSVGDQSSFQRLDPRHRDKPKSFTSSVFASSDSGNALQRSVSPRKDQGAKYASVTGGGQLIVVDKFSFVQPKVKARNRAARDWFKGTFNEFKQKSLRVTQLHVEENFPACVSRQTVSHRKVFQQSPMEAGVDSVCSWCSVLFRTAVATNGIAVLGGHRDQGIGNSAAKVVADCIHSSRVKDIGKAFLARSERVSDDNDRSGGTMLTFYDELNDDEVAKLQTKLARSIVIFLELLHLLIARNRDLLLAVVELRKRGPAGSAATSTGRPAGGASSLKDGIHPVAASSPDSIHRGSGRHRRQHSAARSATNSSVLGDDMASSVDGGKRRFSEDVVPSNVVANISVGSIVSNPGAGNERTDNAIAVQSELQRSFLSMTKTLYPLISTVIGNECPRWLKLCCQDSYFSSYTYRQTRITMGEELFFFSADLGGGGSSEGKEGEYQENTMPFAIGSLFASRSGHGVIGGVGDGGESVQSETRSHCDGASSALSKGSGSILQKSINENSI